LNSEEKKFFSALEENSDLDKDSLPSLSCWEKTEKKFCIEKKKYDKKKHIVFEDLQEKK
jgi:hypothetical protein